MNNKLQNILQLAAQNPEYRSEFYKVFIDSDIYVIGEASGIDNGIAREGSEMTISNFPGDGFAYMAIFSSLEQLRESLSTETKYLKMKCHDFLNMVGPQNIILNPGLKYGKHFTPDEISMIIDKTIFKGSESYVFEKETEVLLGQPARYPYELVEIVKRVCGLNKIIKTAYLVHFHNPSKDEFPHSLIGIEVDGNYEDAVSAIGHAVQSYSSSNNDPVDIYVIKNNGSPIENYCKSIKPIYRRKIFGIF